VLQKAGALLDAVLVTRRGTNDLKIGAQSVVAVAAVDLIIRLAARLAVAAAVLVMS
jgi:hypothetical protein